jgi:hypothetical protein
VHVHARLYVEMVSEQWFTVFIQCVRRRRERRKSKGGGESEEREEREEGGERLGDKEEERREIEKRERGAEEREREREREREKEKEGKQEEEGELKYLCSFLGVGLFEIMEKVRVGERQRYIYTDRGRERWTEQRAWNR